MTTAQEVIKTLQAQARPDQLEGMARYGLVGEKRLGVSVADLRRIAKGLGSDRHLAQELWDTGIPEAMILASMLDVPHKVTEEQMEAWVADLPAWDVCDQVCMNLFEKTPLAWKKIHDWSKREELFVKRTAFALIACLAWHDKKASDKDLIQLIPVIREGAADDRNMVRKAVSWALRNIGKRNRNLHTVALRAAEEIREMGTPPARWIASDVIRDLTGDTVQKRLGLRPE